MKIKMIGNFLLIKLDMFLFFVRFSLVNGNAYVLLEYDLVRTPTSLQENYKIIWQCVSSALKLLYPLNPLLCINI